MDFEFSAEQRELRAVLQDAAADLARDDERWWPLLSRELGLSALVVPEEDGGGGGDLVDAAVLWEESGRALLEAPLLPTLVASAATDDRELLAAVAEGAAATLAVGDPAAGLLGNVIAADVARWLVVAAPDALWVAPLGSCEVDVQEALDPTRRLGRVTIPAGAARQVGDAAASARAVDLLRVALAVEAVGVMRWCLATTVDYLKVRVQFGRPIGTFQALQHRAADLAVRLESAASVAYAAAWAAAASPDELPVLAPLALGTCGEAAYEVAADTIQLHGGIGFTWEHDAHRYFKRATTTRLLLGDTAGQHELAATRAGFAP